MYLFYDMSIIVESYSRRCSSWTFGGSRCHEAVGTGQHCDVQLSNNQSWLSGQHQERSVSGEGHQYLRVVLQFSLLDLCETCLIGLYFICVDACCLRQKCDS